MTHHPHPARTGSIWTGLLARLRSRLSGRARERGDVMVEVIIFMGVISLVAGAYTSSANSAQQVQRSMTSVDIVDQQAQGVLEQAQIQPWETLGFNYGEHTYKSGARPTNDPIDGLPIVRHGQGDNQDAAQTLQPYTPNIVTRGVKMEQTVYVTWTTSPAPTDAAAHGTKKITVVIAYHAPGVPGTKTKTYSATRSSTPSEAVPTSVSGIDEARERNGDDTLVGACPKVYMQVLDRNELNPIEVLRWDGVANATRYYVLTNWGGSNDREVFWDANPPRVFDGSSRSANLHDSSSGVPWKNYKYRVDVLVDGVRIECPMATPIDWGQEPPNCPIGTGFSADARTLTWSRTTDADSYRVVRRLDGAVTTVANVTTTSHTLDSRPTGSEYQVLAVNDAGPSENCTAWTTPTPEPPATPEPTPEPDPLPGCPTGVRFIADDRIAWEPVAGATGYLTRYRVDYSVPGRTQNEISGGSVSSSPVNNAHAYEWQVLAVNAAGTSVNCGTWVQGPRSGPPFCVEDVRVSYRDGSVYLEWTPASVGPMPTSFNIRRRDLYNLNENSVATGRTGTSFTSIRPMSEQYRTEWQVVARNSYGVATNCRWFGVNN